MSINSHIVNGTGEKHQATVRPTSRPNSNAVLTEIGKITSGVEFQVTTSAIGDLYDTYLKLDGTGTIEANVDGSSVAKTFTLLADATFDIQILSMGLVGLDGSIKLANFYGAATLTNGLSISGVSDEVAFDLTSSATIKSTHDIEGFCWPGSFVMRAEAAADSAVGWRDFDPAIILRKQGTFAGEDVMNLVISDNLTTVQQLRFVIRSKKVEAGVL